MAIVRTSSSFPFPTFPHSVVTSLLLFTFLLFNCCLCQPNAFSLRDFACAKKNAVFYNGLFTLIEDDRLRIDPSKQKTNSTQLDALFLNPTKENLIISLIFIKGGKNCKNFFIEHADWPCGCQFGEEREMDGNHFAKGECQTQKCSYVEMTCSVFLMDPVEGLEDSRHFTLSSWSRASVSDMAHCDWIAYIDDIHILKKKSGNDTKTMEEDCWKRDGEDSFAWNVMLIGLFAFLLVVVATVIMCFFFRRRNWNILNTKDADEMDSSMELEATPEKESAPAQTEEPTPLQSAHETSAEGQSISAGQSIAAKHGVEVPESVRVASAAEQSVAAKQGIEVPESIRGASDASDDKD